LLLTRTEGDPENDGLLEAREIMNLRLNADLAMLSAYETANGRISPGEGVIGMSWAFFVAGTRSILVSQWKGELGEYVQVNDELLSSSGVETDRPKRREGHVSPKTNSSADER
jgi:hypothetical protein